MPPLPPIRWNILRHDSADSTNTLATQRILAAWDHDHPAQNLHGLVITAERQTAGRGQHGRSWISPPGGLYLSAVITDFPPPLRDKLALITGVAVARALQASHIADIALRWPNDILLGGKKVAGILCESLARGSNWAAIIGIGINVNTHLADLPSQLQPHATSLLAHSSAFREIRVVEQSLLQHLAIELAQAATDGLAPTLTTARKLDALRGQPITCRDANQTHTGIAAGLGDQGELLLQTPTITLHLQTATLISVADAALPN
jgi:BirA family transcriptional regulator, biotin operon repressor / biotin---[acetyl-CoA-carboxylase] ligase